MFSRSALQHQTPLLNPPPPQLTDPGVQEYASIRIIVDDSGSMRMTETDDLGRLIGTHWDELQATLRSVFDVACAAVWTDDLSTGTGDNNMGTNIDVHLLNGHTDGRKQFFGLRSFAELEQNLSGLPVSGTTPTVRCLEGLMSARSMNALGEKPVLTILFTDGEPDGGIPAFSKFLRANQLMYPNHFITIALCTGDERVVGLYNTMDVDIPRVDVMDDYRSEKREITSIQGSSFPFSEADYLLKMLLGPRITLWDNLDEKKLMFEQRQMFKKYGLAAFGGRGKKKRCVIL